MSDESRVTSRGWRMAENMCHVDAGATVDADRLARVNMQPASGGRGLSLGEYPPPDESQQTPSHVKAFRGVADSTTATQGTSTQPPRTPPRPPGKGATEPPSRLFRRKPHLSDFLVAFSDRAAIITA